MKCWPYKNYTWLGKAWTQSQYAVNVVHLLSNQWSPPQLRRSVETREELCVTFTIISALSMMMLNLPPCLHHGTPDFVQCVGKIPEDFASLICHDIIHDTMEACVRRLPNGKSPGCDDIPREFYK